MITLLAPIFLMVTLSCFFIGLIYWTISRRQWRTLIVILIFLPCALPIGLGSLFQLEIWSEQRVIHHYIASTQGGTMPNSFFITSNYDSVACMSEIASSDYRLGLSRDGIRWGPSWQVSFENNKTIEIDPQRRSFFRWDVWVWC